MNAKQLLLLILLFVSLSCAADQLLPQKDESLAKVLYTLEELNDIPDGPGPYQVRLFTTSDSLGECGGTVESCPDVYFYIVIAGDGLGAKPALYVLPRAKGWKFDKWLGSGQSKGQEDREGFQIETTIPGANISTESRKTWKPTVYDVWVNPASGNFSTHP